jgi:hypothetical protein
LNRSLIADRPSNSANAGDVRSWMVLHESGNEERNLSITTCNERPG